LSAISENDFQIVVLDVMLPGMNGIEILRRIRRVSQLPVLMLTARGDEVDRITGLELGADDYITKPFKNKELVARVKAVLRRTRGSEETKEETDILHYPKLTISLQSYEVNFEDKPVEMPPKELELLHYLASHPNMVFTREQLLQRVWGFDFYGDSRTVDVHVKRLREKLVGCEQYGWEIHTVWRVGYKFEVKR
ncbi:MAG TPA: response regulator transcription factor, partial [Candidatus Limiplasma sp.]|nr:response regulator transcription factor [Candidatus Limiplasma sp.]